MIIKKDKNELRRARHRRVRVRISGSARAPRLNVYRSGSHIYAQVIDDASGCTLAAVNTLQPGIRPLLEGLNRIQQAQLIGTKVGEAALQAGVSDVVFDRGGYLYTGRVAALADGARKAGLRF